MLLEAWESKLGQNERHWESIKAPSEDRQSLVVPHRDIWIDEVTRAARAGVNSTLGPTGSRNWISELRSLARREIAIAATAYVESYLPNFRTATGSLADDGDLQKDFCWIVGGHQPEAFHPGVWFKNFFIDSMVSELSKRGRPALGLHVIVDHDLAKSTSIRVPYLEQPSSGEHPATRFRNESLRLPLVADRDATQAKPWHSHSVDRRELASFAESVVVSSHTLGIEVPLAVPFCHYLKSEVDPSNAALAFSQARHRIEVEAGLRNLEIPMGTVCETKAWSLFVAHCIENSNHLHERYNRCLSAYREIYHVKNPGQPVPPLARNQDWVELPFWFYRKADATRNRLWVRSIDGGYELGSGVGVSEFHWTLRAFGAGEELAAEFRNWFQEGVCLRPRALITTMFLRMFVADGFVHGIGGGLYDRLTDRLIESFLESSAPTYAIATATFRLPLDEARKSEYQAIQSQQEALNRDIHNMRSRPELFLDLTCQEHRKYLQEHQALLADIPPRGSKREWHMQMQSLRMRIRAEIAAAAQRLTEQQFELQRASQQQALLRSREFSFLLFPAERCVQQLRELAQR